MNTANQTHFTPGPWSADYDRREDRYILHGQYSFGHFHGWSTDGVTTVEEDQSNALLISLAPELVGALRGLLELPEIHQCVMEGRARTIDALADARAVLAKLEAP